MKGPAPLRGSRPRGRLTRQHLSTRERPGEIVVVLWFLGFFAFLYSTSAIFIVVEVLRGILPPVGLLYLILPAWLGSCFLGLWRGTRWGWWATCLTLGLFTVLCLLGAVLGILEGRDEMTFSNSLVGMIVMSVFALVSGAPFLLLVRARRRYFERRSTIEGTGKR